MAERLTEATAQAHAALDAAALVLVDPAQAAHREALDRFVAERVGLGRGRAIRVDAAAWRRGRRAAAKLALP